MNHNKSINVMILQNQIQRSDSSPVILKKANLVVVVSLPTSPTCNGFSGSGGRW